MLDLPRYLLGVLEIALLAGFATLGASVLRSRLLPDFTGAPAHLATTVLALALLLWTAELLARGRASLAEWSERKTGRRCAGGIPPPSFSKAERCDRGGAGDCDFCCRQVRTRCEAEAVFGHDRVRFDLVPRAVRRRVLPGRRYLGPALHRAAVPGLVLPGQCRNFPRGWDAGVRARSALAAAQSRLVHRLPGCLLVHWAAVQS